MTRKRKSILLHFLLIIAVILLNTISEAFVYSPLTSEIVKERQYELQYIRKDDKKSVMIEWVLNNSECNIKTANEIVEAVLETEHPILLLSIIKRESEFKPFAISSFHCIGLGQISPIHIKELKEEGIIKSKHDLTTIKGNIKSANYILNLKLRKSKNNVRRALLYYVGDLHRHDYVSSVLKNHSSLTNMIRRG